MNPNDLTRLAELLEVQAETMRLFSNTIKAGNGKASRITELCTTILGIAQEVKGIAAELGAKPER